MREGSEALTSLRTAGERAADRRDLAAGLYYSIGYLERALVASTTAKGPC